MDAPFACSCDRRVNLRPLLWFPPELLNSMQVPLNESTLGPAELQAAKAVLDSGFLTMGRQCAAFEEAFAARFGVRHALMVNSGSSANLIAVFALANPLCPSRQDRLPLEPGSEVIVPALSWSTSVWPIIQAGLVPRFIDCDPETLQSTPEMIEAAIGENTRAIMVVHILGNGVDMPAVRDIAERHRLWLIEDTCESLGVTIDGQEAGSFGDMGTYSFYFSHHITTGEGGMVVTNDDELADLLRVQRAHGWVRHMHERDAVAARYPDIDPRFLFLTTGFNVRPTEIAAAIGIEQLKSLDRLNDARVRVGETMEARLAPLVEAGHLRVVRADRGVVRVPFGFPVLCRDAAAKRGLQSRLEADGIETRPIVCGNMLRQPAMAHLPHAASGSLPGADEIMDCGLYWGAHPNMTDDAVDHVAATARDHFGN